MKRQLIACVLTIGLGCGAKAADVGVDTLPRVVPGTPTYWNWGGFYFGGQYGLASATFDPGSAPSSLIAYILRNTTVEREANVSQWTQLTKSTARASTFGGFVGFNQQWEDAIIGLEMNYNFGRMWISSSDSVARNFLASDGYLYNIRVNSSAVVTLKDYGSLRARAGYVMGRFLPYAMVGFALGRGDVSRNARVRLNGTDVTNTPPNPAVALDRSMSDSRRDAFLYGFSAGVGIDVGITENIFVRAEYEYLQFFPFSGVNVGINTGRVGAAVKF